MTIAAYGGSFDGWFVYEDATGPAGMRLVRWLSQATFIATESVSSTPRAARIVSLGWHLLNGLLLWVLVRPVIGLSATVLAVGLFLLHPIQTESVAYLASRPELVLASCVLLACLASSGGRVWLAGILAGLAIFAKEMGVMAWALVPLWAWFTRQRWRPGTPDLWAASSLLMATVFVLSVAGAGLGQALPWAYYGGQLVALGRLLWLLPDALWSPLTLTIDHDWGWITPSLAAVALLAVPCLLWWTWRVSRLWTFALAWTLLAVLPRLLMPMPDGIHERHLYTPTIALSLAIGASVFPKGMAA